MILRGEFTFHLMGRSFTVICTRPSTWIWIRLTFIWWKCDFKMVKNHILCVELRVVCTLTAVPDTCWAGVSALQHGPVLNHPLTYVVVWRHRKSSSDLCYSLKAPQKHLKMLGKLVMYSLNSNSLPTYDAHHCKGTVTLARLRRQIMKSHEECLIRGHSSTKVAIVWL